MHSACKFALGVLAAAAFATASDVTQLKKDTFDDFIKSNDLVLAECKFPELSNAYTCADSDL